MNRIFPYIIIFIFLLVFISILSNTIKEKYEETNEKRPPGPWGKIGSGHPWYEYPYILHNIEYY